MYFYFQYLLPSIFFLTLDTNGTEYLCVCDGYILRSVYIIKLLYCYFGGFLHLINTIYKHLLLYPVGSSPFDQKCSDSRSY